MSAAFDREVPLRRASDLLSAEVEGELVLMDIRSGLYYGLDAIGSEIWTRLEEPLSVRALALALSRDYEADVETIERDVAALLADLAGRGLVETG